MLSSFLNSSLFEWMRTIITFAIALGILITVHEFGHFWVARRCGVKVLRFSIGFGKTLWKKTDRYGTEFVIAIIPLGGYIKMLDKHDNKDNDNEEMSQQDSLYMLSNKSVWQRMAIVVAGPLANFIFAIFLFWLVFMLGMPGIRPVVPDVIPHSIAERSGIKPGMEIIELDGFVIRDLAKLQLTVMGLQGKNQATAKVISPGMSESQTIILDLKHWTFNPEQDNPLYSLGIKLLTKASLKVDAVVDKSPAQKAGLISGDMIIKINDQIMKDSAELAKIIQQHPGEQLKLEINRNNVQHVLYVIPETKLINEKKIGFVGIYFAPDQLDLAENRIVNQYDVFTSLGYAADRTWQLSLTMLKEIGHMFAGNRSLQSLAGPVTIAKGAGQAASKGFVDYCIFLALISINLGIINLLPVPVLDGGHLIFLIVEKVTGRPVSEKVLEYSTRMGLLILMLLMGLSFFNDFSH